MTTPRNKFYTNPVEIIQHSFLDSHQIRGITHILTRKHSYLAHTPGAGKTAQAIVASRSTSTIFQIPRIFIVPPTLVTNWIQEIKKFESLMKLPPTKNIYTIIAGTKPFSTPHETAPTFIVADTMLTKSWVKKLLFSTITPFIAVDEASRFKDPTAQRTIALFGGVLKDGTTTPGLQTRALHMVLMDGSPMPNRPMELWAPLFALTPETINHADHYKFGFRFCGPRKNAFGKWEFKGASNEDELQKLITRDFMHVVPESELNHPERLRSILLIDETYSAPEYKEWERTTFNQFNLSQISESDSRGELSRFRREIGIQKAPWIAEYVAGRLSHKKDESIIIFTWHREVGDQLTMRLQKFSPRLIIGGTDQAYRDLAIDHFNQGIIRLLIMNIQAGGRGLNIPKADRIIFAEYAWCDETNKQAEKRASRKGRDPSLPVRCEYLVLSNSIDEYVVKALMVKEKRVRRIIK